MAIIVQDYGTIGGGTPQVFTDTGTKTAGTSSIVVNGLTFEPKFIRLILNYGNTVVYIWDNLKSDMSLDNTYIGCTCENSNYRTTWNYSSGTLTLNAWNFSGGATPYQIIIADKLMAVE